MASRLVLKRFNGREENWRDGIRRAYKHVEQSAFFYGGKVAEECANDLLKKSKELCPMDTGHLVNSGEVIEAVKTKNKNNVKAFKVSYDTTRGIESGAKVDSYNYAVRIHESPELNFNKDKNPNAQAFYLKKPLDENINEYKQKIADEIKKGIRRG